MQMVGILHESMQKVVVVGPAERSSFLAGLYRLLEHLKQRVEKDLPERKVEEAESRFRQMVILFLVPLL